MKCDHEHREQKHPYDKDSFKERTNMHAISVVVTTYNQPYTGIFHTLDSIVKQAFEGFEIIVADDCSKESPKEVLEEYFSNVGFSDYKIVINSSNVGTVRNILGVHGVADGEFIKVIGAGDMLYSSDTLRKIYEFSRSRKTNFAFGKIKAFSLEGADITIQPFNAPLKTELYITPQNREAILAQQLIGGDWIPGASLFYRRDYLEDYLSALAVDYQVRYCEDLVSPLVAFEDAIDYFDEYILWYEWGVGISNNGSVAARKKMYKDHSNFFSELSRRYRNNGIVTKAYRRFKVKRFVMLHTPLYRLLGRFKSAQYLKGQENQSGDLDSGKAFLLTNLDLKS